MITNVVKLGSKKYGTTGHLLSNIQAKIVDTSDSDKILGPNQEGELCIKTPAVR